MAPHRHSPNRRPRPATLDSGRHAPRLGSGCPWDVWDAWLVAQAEVELAYREWSSAPPKQREERYVRYRAALEREDRAAAILSATAHAVGIAA
jgi:hypothetical protein